MAPALPLVALVLVGEALDLRTLGLTDDSGAHRRRRELRDRSQHLLAVDDEDGTQGHFLAGQLLDVETLTLFDAVLLAAGLDHCIHGARSPREWPGAEPCECSRGG